MVVVVGGGTHQRTLMLQNNLRTKLCVRNVWTQYTGHAAACVTHALHVSRR